MDCRKGPETKIFHPGFVNLSSNFHKMAAFNWLPDFRSNAPSSFTYDLYGGNGDCSGAANGGGSCKFGSCQFDRAPDPHKEFLKTCDYKNAKMSRELENQCSAKG